MKAQKTIDEFAFILLGSLIFIMVLAIYFTQEQISVKGDYNHSYNITKKLSQYTVLISNRINISASNTTKIFDQVGEKTVEKGYFSEDDITLILPKNSENVKNVILEFLVRDTNNEGELEVYVNNMKIWRKKAAPGIYTIHIPVEYLTNDENYLRLKATNPGWKFWMKSAYVIEYAKIIVTKNEEKIEKIPFSIEKEILDKTLDATLLFQKSPSIETSNLVIEINNHVVYNKKPFTKMVEVKIDRNILSENNMIKFYVNGEAYYDIRNVRLVLYYKE